MAPERGPNVEQGPAMRVAGRGARHEAIIWERADEDASAEVLQPHPAWSIAIRAIVKEDHTICAKARAGMLMTMA